MILWNFEPISIPCDRCDSRRRFLQADAENRELRDEIARLKDRCKKWRALLLKMSCGILRKKLQT